MFWHKLWVVVNTVALWQILRVNAPIAGYERDYGWRSVFQLSAIRWN